jgi:hypothetical protein
VKRDLVAMRRDCGVDAADIDGMVVMMMMTMTTTTRVPSSRQR